MTGRTDKLRGSMVALVTPFKGGEIDETALRALVEWQIEAGTHVIVPCGTTGESPTLSHNEHKRVVEIVIDQAAGRVPVMAGTGSNATNEAVDLIQHAESAGASAALVVTPYYNKPTQSGLYAHFEAIHNAVSELPIIIYNIPSRSVVDMSVDTMTRLADLKNIVGVKDATANLARMSLQRLACGPEFIELSGEDATALGFMAHGGHGCISVCANIMPAECAEFQEKCLAGDFVSALKLHEKLMPMHDVLFTETSPGPIKYALSRIGKCESEMRLPMVDIAPESAQKIDKVLDQLGLLRG